MGLTSPLKEWEFIASQLEIVASSKELSLKFTKTWEEVYPWLSGIQYVNGHVFNIDVEYVKNKLDKIDIKPQII